LQIHYGLIASIIEFLQLGHDSNGWVYRVITTKQTYFLKVKKLSTVTHASVRLPYYLRQCGLTQVVAPLATQAQTLWADVENFHLLVYPYIEGTDAMTLGLTEAQYHEYGAILKALHTAPLTTEIQSIVPKETFHSKWLAVVNELQQKVDTQNLGDTFEKELAEFWQSKQSLINGVVARTQALGQQLAQASTEFVICHADIHTANILVAKDGGLYVVDWDDPIIAPKERDLMFVVGTRIGGRSIMSREEDLIFEGYGSKNIDPLALAYYRNEWVVADVGGWGQSVFDKEVGPLTKQSALKYFKALFVPGNVMDVANESAAN